MTLLPSSLWCVVELFTIPTQTQILSLCMLAVYIVFLIVHIFIVVSTCECQHKLIQCAFVAKCVQISHRKHFPFRSHAHSLSFCLCLLLLIFVAAVVILPLFYALLFLCLFLFLLFVLLWFLSFDDEVEICWRIRNMVILERFEILA